VAHKSALVTTKRVVVTVHGIRTHATWQKTVTPILNRSGLIVEPHDYGRFGFFRFARQSARDAEVERFRALYEGIVKNKDYDLDPDDPTRRPSVVAHSLGTYIVGHCMRRHSYVRFDKVILCGSILSRGFDWSELFARDQVNFVKNLRCMKDPWVPRAHLVVPDAGSSGVDGFSYWGRLLEERRRDECSHSDFFSEADVQEDWIRFLGRRPSTFRIIHSRVIETDPDLEGLLDQTHQIDTKVFANCPHYFDQELPRGVSTGWTDVNRDIYTFLVLRNTQRPIGYVNAMPVTNECFDEILAGRKQDNEITPDDVASYEPGSVLSLYLMSIAVDPEYRKTNSGLDSEPVERLLNGVIGKLVCYATQSDIRVSRIVAIGWTPVGRKLCKRLGMTAQGKDRFCNEIFYVDFSSPSSICDRYRHPGIKRLMTEYSRMIAK